MSILFGEIRQLAFVVDDIDQAMEYWAGRLGIGPFFIKRQIRFVDYVYRSKLMASPLVSIALANSGYIQIELIQQHDDAPSIYQEFLQQGRTGLQHMAAWLNREDFDIQKAKLAKRMVIAQQCTIESSGVRLAYFDTGDGPNAVVFEIADLKEPHQYERVMGIADAAMHWDGVKISNEVSE